MLNTDNVSGAVSPMPIVEIINGELMVSSVNVAKCFEKNHTSVLRGIRAALSQYPEEFTETNFEGVNQMMIMACILHTNLHEQKSSMPQMCNPRSG